MTTLPTCLVILQALLTPVIAAAVGFVAFMQWRTAHQKVMLDLFEKRFAVFMDVRRLVSLLTARGELDAEDFGLENEIYAKGRFLFDEKVTDLLIDIQLLSIEVQTSRLSTKSLNEKFSEFQLAIDIYLRMDQKRVRTPVEWFHDKNKKRLSYADEKQR